LREPEEEDDDAVFQKEVKEVSKGRWKEKRFEKEL